MSKERTITRNMEITRATVRRIHPDTEEIETVDVMYADKLNNADIILKQNEVGMVVLKVSDIRHSKVNVGMPYGDFFRYGYVDWTTEQ